MHYKFYIKVLTLFLLITLVNIKETKNKTQKNYTPINNIQSNLNTKKEFITNIKNIEEDIYNELLATISIKKINLINKPIYNINSKKNNIEKNITILKESSMPDNNSSIIFLLAHSGTGERAYFKNIHKLKEKDIIDLTFNGKNYTYKVEKVYEENKDGYLKVTKEYQKELVITTCSQNKEKQLIVIASLQKESNK